MSVVAYTNRQRLSYLVDAMVEILDEDDLRMTPMTRMDWRGLDKELVDRVAWELEDYPPDEVARICGCSLKLVQGVAQLGSRS